jgi:hypothetical protein
MDLHTKHAIIRMPNNQQYLNIVCIYIKFIITDKTAILGHSLPQKILPDYSFLEIRPYSLHFFGISNNNSVYRAS